MTPFARGWVTGEREARRCKLDLIERERERESQRGLRRDKPTAYLRIENLIFGWFANQDGG